MPDYNTAQKKRNMIVGAFVIVAFCAFGWMVFIFGELPVAVSRFRSFKVLVIFANAPGVQKNTPVKYCGYPVGKVTYVMAPERAIDRKTGQAYHQIKVEMAIEKKYVNSIPSHVKVMLMKRGLGSSYIELVADSALPLVPKDPARPETAFLMDEMVLEGATGVSSEFFPPEVQAKLEKLVDSISALADNANEIIGDTDNKANVKKTLSNVTIMTAQATETLKSIKEFSNTATAKLESAAENLNDTLVEFRGILAKANNGDSTAAKLLNDGRLYENLLDSSQELQMALEQLKILAADAREKGIKIKW